MTSSGGVPLQLWDPVSVESSSAQALQGVVAHLGPVDFSKGTDDFVGIRLTGASVGLGKNNGTVEGQTYFEAGSNSGLFVRYSSGKITKRKLTKLQELQLKRELGLSAMRSTSSVSSSPTATKTTPLSKGKSSSSVTSATKASLSSTPKTPASTGDKSSRSITESTNVSSKNFSRIEAIRRRREEATAAVSAKTTSASESSHALKSTTTTSSVTKTRTTKGSNQSLGDEDAESVASARSGASSLASESVGKSSTSRNARLEELKAEREARVLRSASGKAKAGSSIPPRSGSKSIRPVSSVSHPRTPSSASSKQTLESKFASEAEQAFLEYKEKWQEADEELQRKDHELQQLKKELEVATTQNQSKQNELETKSEEIRKLAAELKDLKEAKQTDKSTHVPSEVEERDYDSLLAEKERLESKLDELSGTVSSLREELSTSRDNSSDEVALLKSDLLAARSRALAAEKEVETIQEQAAAKSTNAAGFMKERAKMSSEISALHRRIAELEAGQVDHDTMMEDVALDKEALQEEKEELQDKVQEMEMEIASLQVELEEAKVELDETKLALEDARQSAASAAVVAASGEVTAQEGDTGTSSTAADAQDVCRALATQNGRLREALVRLREQSNFEKIQLTKQLRDAEKDAAAGRELTSEVEKLREAKTSMSTEIRELKEMVDTNAMFETIVEELSDKVTSLEDENIELRNAVRDMEEAGEMAEEMEEVQGEEIKSLRREVENRDTTIRNLQEAIKVQRRREVDLQRTVGNYRSVIDTLKQEKASLLELREEGEGTRNQLIAASQRALGQAAQLVSEQEARRKRDAVAAFDKVNAQTGSYLALRLESLMPGTAEISTEIAATKGELLLSKVITKGSLFLATLKEQFASSISLAAELSLRPSVEFENLKEGELASIHLDDETFQKIENLLFGGKCCEAVIGASSECSSLLLSNQWPGSMAIEDSREVGSAATGPASNLDQEVSTLLRSLNEEGQLSPHRSSIATLVQSTSDMKQNLIDASGKPFVSEAIRTNECLRILKDATCTKFAVQSAAAAFAEAANYFRNADDKDVSTPLHLVSEKAERVVKEMDRIMLVVPTLSYSGDNSSLSAVATGAVECKEDSGAFLSSIQNIFRDEKIMIDSINEAEHAADKLLKAVVRLSTMLKEAGLVGKEEAVLHYLSPEHSDPWQGLNDSAKNELGDAGVLMFEKRAQKVEQIIADAFESEGNLSLFKAKAESLEKTLTTRSQEIAMQTVRMVELEKLLSQLSESDPKTASPQKSKEDAASLESLAKLTEENRVLTEALDVLHAQVDEYEAEIRTLKEAGGKSVSRRALFTPKGKGTSMSDLGSTLSLLGKESSSGATSSVSASNEAAILKMEASLFRPALAEAKSEAAVWRGRSMCHNLGRLKPLNVPKTPMRFASTRSSSRDQPQEGVTPERGLERKEINSDLKRIGEELILASMEWRMSKASTKLLSINGESSSKSTTSRLRLRSKQYEESKIEERLDSAFSSARKCFMKCSGEAEMGEGVWVSPSLAISPVGQLTGAVTLKGVGAGQVVPVEVDQSELSKLHSLLLQ